jgi:hypothetical protein
LGRRCRFPEREPPFQGRATWECLA